MTTRPLALLAVSVVVGSLAWLWVRGSGSPGGESLSRAEERALDLAPAGRDSTRESAVLTGAAPAGDGRTLGGQGREADAADVPGFAADPQESPRAAIGAPIEGRALLMNGHPLAGFHVSVEPKRGATTQCRADAEGEFVLSVERDVTYRLEVTELKGHKGAPSSSVIAPAIGVELRVDGLLVRVRAAADTGPIGMVHMTIRPTGGGPAPFRMSTLMSDLGDGQFIEQLLPTGPGYHFVADRGPERPLVGVIDPGLLSGVVDVELRESHAACATVGVVVAGEPLSAPNRVLLTLHDEARSFTFIRVESGHREAWSGAILPGRYTLTAQVSGVPPFGWARAKIDAKTLELAAGDVRTVDVHLVPAGSISVLVTIPERAPTAPEPTILVAVYDETREDWRNLAMHVRLPDGGRSVSSSLAPHVLHHSEELFEAGEQRVRATAPGWRTVEGIVDVHAGRENAWTVALEPDR